MDKNQKNTRKDKILKLLKLYVLPIVVGTIFILIITGMVLPKVNEIFNGLDNLGQINQNLATKKQEVDALKALSNNFNELSAQLEVVNQIAPTGRTEVVKFRDRITEVIKKNNLQVISQTLSENDFDLKNLQDQKVVGNIILQEVPFLFEVKGKYNNILAFINDLSSVDDFVIVKEMQLASTNTTGNLFTDDWVFKMNLIKYQFSNSNTDLLEKAYLGVSPTSQISKIISDYIAARQASQNQTEPTSAQP